MAFDLDATLRRLRPGRQTAPLARRPDRDLPLIGDPVLAGPGLLLDTSVYIDVLQGRAPDVLKRLLLARQVNHSSVALAELMHLFGRLDPAHRGTGDILRPLAAAIRAIPPHRLAAPTVRAAAEAGVVTGLVARLAGLPRADRQPLLNDAMLFLQALDSGMILLSANVADMDYLLQLVPAGRVLLYRRLA